MKIEHNGIEEANSDSLTLAENEELVSLEASIAEGLAMVEAGWRKTGTALQQVRDRKLYREGYQTFAEYCDKRWDLHRSRAYRLIDAVQIVIHLENLSPRGDKILPQNERQLRPLAEVMPEDQPKVWAAAVETANGQQPTMEQVQATVEKEVPPERRVDRRPKSKREKLAEKVGMRVAFDGSIVPKDFSDDDRRKAIAEMNELRAKRESKRRAIHGPLNVFPTEEQAAVLAAKEAAAHKNSSSRKGKIPSIESRFRNHARSELMLVLRRYFRKSEYARVCELLTHAINKTAP